MLPVSGLSRPEAPRIISSLACLPDLELADPGEDGDTLGAHLRSPRRHLRRLGTRCREVSWLRLTLLALARITMTLRHGQRYMHTYVCVDR